MHASKRLAVEDEDEDDLDEFSFKPVAEIPKVAKPATPKAVEVKSVPSLESAA